MDKIINKKPMVAVLLAIMLVSMLLSMPVVVADMGPKPQATFDVVGTENLGKFHIILFYDNDSPGYPHCSGGEKIYFEDEEEELASEWGKLYSYTYPELNYSTPFKNVSGEVHITYNYYAPTKFAIMLVSEDYSKVIKTQVMERKYFEGFYTVDFQGITWDECENGQIVGKCKTDHKWWYTVVSTLARMAATVVIECLIALIFIRSKKDFAFIAIVNLISNFLLNFVLSLIDFFGGYQFFLYMMAYVFFEVVVIVAEAVAYCKKMPHIARHKLVLYAIFANIISYVVGMMVGMPIWAGIFG
ncbi:MAG: hypothetical protein ACI4MO_04020 [Christensenellales bacterium]